MHLKKMGSMVVRMLDWCASTPYHAGMNLKREVVPVQDQELCSFRVWPDGTAQALEDGVEPYSWMSDDFAVVKATSEQHALQLAESEDK